MIKIKRTTKIWLFSLLATAGLILVVVMAINPLLKNLLATQVENELVGNFHYNYDKLSVDLLTRSVTFDKVTWRFPKDTTVFYQRGGMRRLRISGISLLSLIKGNDLRIHEIRFDSLNYVARIEKVVKKDSIAKIESKSVPFNFYDLIKGQLNSLEVERIRITDGMATWLNPETKIIWRKIDEVQFNISHIHLDSAIAAANNGWFTLQDATLEGKGGELFLADSLHKVQLKKFQIDYRKQTISIDSLQLVPLIAKSRMPYARRYETSRMEITTSKIRVTGMDIQELMRSNKLQIEHVLIDELSMEVFRDKNPPIPYHLRIDLPQTVLKNAMLNIKIDTVHLKNGYIRYEELSDLTQKKGVVFFNGVNAVFLNITNDSLSVRKNPLANLKLSARVMGKGKLESDITFNLLSGNGDHWIQGSLSQFEMTDLNAATVPLRSVSIRSGYIDKMDFDIRLNDYVADGKVSFLYSDLKIDMLDEEDLNRKAFDSVIKSFLANTFLVQTSNPSGKNDPRIGIVHYYRETDKSIINFWLKSILEGVKSTVSNSKENS